jgi:ligand-binding sensor domain-containing protein
LSHDHVSSLAVTPDNQLIIGTLGGIDVPNMEMNRFEHIDVGNDMTLSNNFVTA